MGFMARFAPARRWAMVAALTAAVAVLSIGCSNEPSAASELSGPRFLAAAFTPSSVVLGHEVVIDVLTWEVTDVAWRGCSVAWVGTADGLECPIEAFELGEGLPLVLTPEDEMFLLAEDISGGETTAHPMVVRLDEGGPDAHLNVTGVVDSDGAQLTTVETEAELEMHATVDVEVSSGGVTTFFASAGAFAPWRAAGTETSTFIAPEEPGAVTIIAVVRETDGAVGWTTTTLTVVAP